MLIGLGFCICAIIGTRRQIQQNDRSGAQRTHEAARQTAMIEAVVLIASEPFSISRVDVIGRANLAPEIENIDHRTAQTSGFHQSEKRGFYEIHKA
ncbi:MAG: hypothetical protein WDN08_03915 [Rhizomicrobium sp.]